MAIPWLTLWQYVFTLAVGLTTAIVIFLVTLPKSYTHFHPGYISKDSFSEDDRKDSSRSGYAYFEAHKDEHGRHATKATVQVVVLGDIGRSPRMQYHASSLAKHGAGVQLIGYVDTSPHPDIVASRFIKVVEVAKIPRWLQTGQSRAIFLVTGPLKALYQTWALYETLAYRTTASRYMLVQNPPSIPVLVVAVFVCFFRNTKLIIDWHNFGYSILALRLGKGHPLVRISRWYEGRIGRGAHAHFTVTDAMRRKIKSDFDITASTLHDRPADQFQPATEQQRWAFLESCTVTRPFAQEIRQGTRRLIVSSTSWTADEDFSIMLDALVTYSKASKTDDRLPRILAIITGKGPHKQYYEDHIRSLDTIGCLQNVDVHLAWLSIEDYASLLAAADLGICLHTSSSGVDLPMKVLDMFGAGIPVAGWSKYESWPELVHEGINGLGFGSADELYDILEELFAAESSKLQAIKHGALKEGQYRWQDEWDKNASKAFHLQL